VDGQAVGWMLLVALGLAAFVWIGTEIAARPYRPPCEECGRRSDLVTRHLHAYCCGCWEDVAPRTCTECSSPAIVTLIAQRHPLCEWHWAYCRARMQRADYEREMREADMRARFGRP
jgi:hypothetical protein